MNKMWQSSLVEGKNAIGVEWKGVKPNAAVIWTAPPPHPAPIEGYPVGAFTITVSEMQWKPRLAGKRRKISYLGSECEN